MDFGGRITADDLFSNDHISRGFDVSKYATVMLDHRIGWEDVARVAKLNVIEAKKRHCTIS